MGYMRHHAIIVTGVRNLPESKLVDPLRDAHTKALEVFGAQVSPLVPSPLNGYGSFFVAPDGSKEGWPESDVGDEQRAAFIAWLRSPEQLGWHRWVCVQYGDDRGEVRIIDSNDSDPDEDPDAPAIL